MRSTKDNCSLSSGQAQVSSQLLVAKTCCVTLSRKFRRGNSSIPRITSPIHIGNPLQSLKCCRCFRFISNQRCRRAVCFRVERAQPALAVLLRITSPYRLPNLLTDDPRRGLNKIWASPEPHEIKARRRKLRPCDNDFHPTSSITRGDASKRHGLSGDT